MSFYRIPRSGLDDVLVLFTAAGVRYGTIAAEVVVPPTGDIAPALTVEYVDSSGVRRTTEVADGVTTISGVAPFLVEFDSTASRAPSAFAAQGAIADAEAYAYLMVGHHMGYGEGSGTWDYPAGTSYSRAEDTGPPLFGHIYRTPGTYLAQKRTRDSLGNEVTIALNVNVSAPPAATHIPVADGSWPAFVSGSRYTLDADGDYRGFGVVDTGGLHNIIFEKVGAGADPMVSSVVFDGRSKFSAVAPLEFRAAHIRMVNIDIAALNEDQRGYDYCGILGGLIRECNGGPQTVFWSEGTAINRANVRHVRGLFLEDTEVRSSINTNGYVMINTLRSFHARNTRFVHQVNGETTWAMLRLYGAKHTLRNCLWRSAVDGGTNNGTVISQLSIAGQVPTAWRDDDLVGPTESSNADDIYGYIGQHQVMHRNQLYDAGSFVTNAIASVGSGNPEGLLKVYPRLIGWEDNVFYPASTIAQSNSTLQLFGEYCYARNNRTDMGSGSYVATSTGAPNASIGDTVTYNGPFFTETANTRPVL